MTRGPYLLAFTLVTFGAAGWALLAWHRAERSAADARSLVTVSRAEHAAWTRDIGHALGLPDAGPATLLERVQRLREAESRATRYESELAGILEGRDRTETELRQQLTEAQAERSRLAGLLAESQAAAASHVAPAGERPEVLAAEAARAEAERRVRQLESDVAELNRRMAAATEDLGRAEEDRREQRERLQELHEKAGQMSDLQAQLQALRHNVELSVRNTGAPCFLEWYAVIRRKPDGSIDVTKGSVDEDDRGWNLDTGATQRLGTGIAAFLLIEEQGGSGWRNWYFAASGVSEHTQDISLR